MQVQSSAGAGPLESGSKWQVFAVEKLSSNGTLPRGRSLFPPCGTGGAIILVTAYPKPPVTLWASTLTKMSSGCTVTMA